MKEARLNLFKKHESSSINCVGQKFQGYRIAGGINEKVRGDREQVDQRHCVRSLMSEGGHKPCFPATQATQAECHGRGLAGWQAGWQRGRAPDSASWRTVGWTPSCVPHSDQCNLSDVSEQCHTTGFVLHLVNPTVCIAVCTESQL